MRTVKRAVIRGINRLGYDLIKKPREMAPVIGDAAPEVRRIQVPPPTELFTAAEQGNAKSVARLLAGGFDPNAQRSDGVTPLVLAAGNGHLEATHALLEGGADPKITTSDGWYAYHFAKNSKHEAVAARLLEAHGGAEPVYDYAAAFLKKAEPQQLAVYDRLFARDAIEKKRFVNVSAGNWRHPYWTNTEYASDYYNYDRKLIDVPWDISQFKPVDVETNSIELAYCSHTAEHLTDEHDRFMFREVHRILKTDGVFRVTCPNVELYYQACMRRDPSFLQNFDMPETTASGVALPVWFVNEIATQLVQDLPGHKPTLKGNVGEIDSILRRMTMEEACDHFCSMIDYEVHKRFPGNHINWWTNEKMCRELRAAGFSRAVISLPGASISAAMRDRAFFDIVNPSCSLFVDAIK